MKFKCRQVSIDFTETAPMRFVNQIELETTPEKVFAIFEDAASWPQWFKDIVNVTWTSPKPFKVGTTRTVKLRGITVWEEFIVWETGKRFAFYFTETSLPGVFTALCEDYQLAAIGKNRTRFTHIVAVDPGPVLRLAEPVAKLIMGRMFRKGQKRLAKYVKRHS